MQQTVGDLQAVGGEVGKKCGNLLHLHWHTSTWVKYAAKFRVLFRRTITRGSSGLLLWEGLLPSSSDGTS